MAFGDEDLMELRAQLIGAGQEPWGARGERGFGLGMASGAGDDTTRRVLGHGNPQERDEFLKMVGHELRNPLATIQSSVDLLQAHASPEEPPYVQQARPRLARQVEHLSRLVEVLLGSDSLAAAPGGAGGEAAATVALVRRMVELQGGRVATLGGGPGCDTELRVWLPAAPPEEPATGGSLPVAPKSRSRRILVVDDNEDAAEMLALVLRKRGFTVVLAFDGEEALAMAQAHHPDVVLLDIGLPGIDGYEVARRLRASPLPARPVLVAVTGYGQPADRVRSRDAGFDHHLVKPVAMEKLLPLLESADEARDPSHDPR